MKKFLGGHAVTAGISSQPAKEINLSRYTIYNYLEELKTMKSNDV